MIPTRIGVVGLWHLGCTIAATWANLGHEVRAVDFDSSIATSLAAGTPPLFEPGLEGAIREALDRATLTISSDPSSLTDCPFVFVTYDTPIRDDDTSDTAVIATAMERIIPFLRQDVIVVMSAQLPVGTSARLRSMLKLSLPDAELVYSPENLRLGEALACYRYPGHIVIGADDARAGDAVGHLFAPMDAACLRMSLASAEMAKHGINSFLATSITFSNQLADLCAQSGADFWDVSRAMRSDPRIGAHAYLTPGIGFSGGTLGRDLRVLDQLSQQAAGGRAPLFGALWTYNHKRARVVRERCHDALGGIEGKTIGLLGMTYKPGTSTLRRSLPLEVARDLVEHGSCLRAYDPRADWQSASVPAGVAICSSPYEAAQDADAMVLLTEWPEFKSLEFGRLRGAMNGAVFFDTKNFLADRHDDLHAAGLQVLTLGRA